MRRRGRGSGLRGLGLGGGLEHVLLADAAADAGAREARDVDALLRGELAHERGQVRADGRAAAAAGAAWAAGRAAGACAAGAGAGRLRRGCLRRRAGAARRRCRRRRRGRGLRAPALAGAGGGRLLGGCRRRRRGRSRAAPEPITREEGADLDGLVLLDEDLLERAGDRRRDLGVDLVGRDLEQRLVDGDVVADRLEPAGHGALGDATRRARAG